MSSLLSSHSDIV